MAQAYKPLVTVVIAFLNEERFLGEAIESVLHQDYTNWELLLVDDGSTNSSTQLAKQYAKKSPGRIRYLEHEGHINKGVCASRNHAVAQASGKLIAFLDADDVWLPGKLSDQVRIFGQHPQMAMVAEASAYWYSWDDPKMKDITIPVGAPQDVLYAPQQLTGLLYPLGEGAAPCPSGLMLAKDAIERVGGFEESFTKKYQLYEDQAFLSKVYLQESVYISSSCNNLYRQREGSCVQWVHADGQYHAVRRHFLEWFEAFLQQRQVNDTNIQRLLKKALLPYRHPNLHFLTRTLPGRLKRSIKKRMR